MAILLVAGLASLVGPLLTYAPVQESVQCEEAHIGQRGDWLSEGSQEHTGDFLAYDLIVQANNSRSDDAYTDIENPDWIEPGWVLCVPKVSGQAATAPDLTRTVWQWQRTLLNNDDRFAPDNPGNYTIQFMANGTVTGSAGCNRYGAGYQVDGNVISIGLPTATRRFCAEPEGIMAQEQEYLAALNTAGTYRITGDSMEMRAAKGSIVGTFEAAKLSSLQ